MDRTYLTSSRPVSLTAFLRSASSGPRCAAEVATMSFPQMPEASRQSFFRWLWVKNRYPKWNPGKWQNGPKPVPWWFNFDPYPDDSSLVISIPCPRRSGPSSALWAHGHKRLPPPPQGTKDIWKERKHEENGLNRGTQSLSDWFVDASTYIPFPILLQLAAKPSDKGAF